MGFSGPVFGAFHDPASRLTVRPAFFAGRSYASTERSLRSQLGQFFHHPQGAGAPWSAGPTATPSAQNGVRLRGVLSPHIDFQRGGPVYTWAYRELVERSDADVFVVFGVAHQPCASRFALTTTDFDTPLGVVPTDRDFVERIAARAGRRIFDDERAHKPEHSIEFQAVFLKYLLDGRRRFSIVPILVGSFHDLMTSGVDPIDNAEVRQFVEAVRAAEQECGKKVAYIGGIDLSHVGPEFGDLQPVDQAMLQRLDVFDRAMLGRAVASDPRGWFETAARVGNRWRVCGLAATYTMLHTMGHARGRLLRYDRAVDDRHLCCVSFASVAFEADRD
jgi:AmmeMemoRadiSam system protein B